MTLTPDDRLALFDLVARANHALHVRDGEGWAATFAEDGVFLPEGGEEIRGRTALAAMIDGIPPNTERHWAANFVLEVVDDAVVMRSDAAVLDMNRVLHAGRRIDTLRRLDGRWRFVKRRFVAAAGDLRRRTVSWVAGTAVPHPLRAPRPVPRSIPTSPTPADP